MSLALVGPCLGLSSFVPTFLFQIPSPSYFTLTVSMREVYRVGYTPRAWDPRSLQSIPDGSLYFEA